MKYAVPLVLVIGLMAACGPPPQAPAGAGVRIPAQVLVRSKGRVVAVSLEDYTLGTVVAEVNPSTETPAVAERIDEVQAIIARTYAVAELGRHRSEGFDLCDSTHCQVYDPDRARRLPLAAVARQAVAATAGRVLTYHGHIAETFFHADCGGATAAADDVWGGEAVPYLIGAPDDIAPAKHRSWTSTVSSADLLRALDADPTTAVGRRLDRVEIRRRDASGRAASLEIRGDTTRVVDGDDFRAIVNRTLGERTIDSTRFSLITSTARYTFTGTGFGHGVGLCQLGAAARARRGEALDSILEHYFPGTFLRR
jgi:stage II sporulation protein D